MASDAQKFVSAKTKKIMDEGTTNNPKQAVAIASSYARKEGFHVPKKLVDREHSKSQKKAKKD